MPSPFYAIGRYACKVVDQGLGKTGTGKPQFALRFQVLGLVDPADPSKYIPATAQYERTFYRTITEKTMPYFIEDLKSLGFEGNSFRDLDKNTGGFHDFRGKDVDMWCAHEADLQGNQREKWGVARQGGGAMELKPLESKEARELDNLFGKHLKGMRHDPAAPALPPETRSVPENSFDVTDDDVPF